MMVLAHEDEVADRVGALLRDVGPLHAVAGLGFADSDPSRVDKAFGRVRARRGLTFIDLRDSADSDAAKTLGAVLNEPVIVAATRADKPARPLLDLVRAGVDRSREVAITGAPRRPRREDQTVILVLQGAESLEGLPRDLTRIPYWDFIGG